MKGTKRGEMMFSVGILGMILLAATMLTGFTLNQMKDYLFLIGILLVLGVGLYWGKSPLFKKEA